MKKLLLLAVSLFTVAGAQAAVNFDIWNKTPETVYFEVGTEANPPTGKNMKELRGSSEAATSVKGRLFAFGKHLLGKATSTTETDTYYQGTIDNKGKVLILLSHSKTVTPGQKAVLVTINANGKDVIVRLKQDNSGIVMFEGDSNKYLFGDQTGLGKGMKVPEAISKKLGGKVPAGRISERGLSLENNITQADISIDTNYSVK